MSTKYELEAYQALLDTARVLDENREWVAERALTPRFTTHFDPVIMRYEVCENDSCLKMHQSKVIVSGHYIDDERQASVNIRVPKMLEELVPGPRPGMVSGTYVRRANGLDTYYVKVAP